MSKTTILCCIAVTVICLSVYLFQNKPIILKGVGGGKPIGLSAKTSNNDGGKTAEGTTQKQQNSREQFVAFDEWPTAANNYAVETNQVPAKDANDRNSAKSSTPQSVLEDEFRSVTELYKGLANRLDKQGISAAEHDVRIRKLQSEYDEKIKALFKNRQKLDAMQKLIDNGSIGPEEGDTAMWRMVLPDETIKIMNSKPKSQLKGNSTSVYGTVTGILSDNEKPLVMIDGEIHSEGDTFHNVRIVKILRDGVEFEYKGRTWRQSVNEAPSSNWPH
jgi:hypothetical protein